MRVYNVTRRGREHIGDSVVRVLQELEAARDFKEDGVLRIVAIVPRILAFFATGPDRYEVTEVDIIVE